MTEQLVLGFDFGTRRIGVALGNSITREARPLRVVVASPAAARWNAIAAVLQEWRPDRIVVGLPRHPDGAEHAMTRQAQRFGNQLHGRYGLPVVFVDERYSSAVLQGESNDADAAAVILQQWLDEQTELGAPIPALPPHAGEGGFEPSRCANDEDK
jgi:putative Holliday junction resolvase